MDPVDDPIAPTDEPSSEVDGSLGAGFGGGFSDFVLFGLYNGAFQKGPSDPSANLDLSTSLTSSNWMPNWRFVQSSNTNITAKQVRDVLSPSGSNLRFTFASGAVDDEAYVEQIVDVGGSRARIMGAIVRAYALRTSGAAAFDLRVMLQYLTVDGAPISNATQTNVGIALAGTLVSCVAHASTDSSPSQQIKYLRVRLVANRTSGTGAGSIDISDVRLERGSAGYVVGERTAPDSYGPGYVVQANGILYVLPNRTSINTSPVGIAIKDSTEEIVLDSTLLTVGGAQTNIAASATVTPLVLQGFAAQSANFFEIDDSAAAVVASVDSTGVLTLNPAATGNGLFIQGYRATSAGSPLFLMTHSKSDTRGTQAALASGDSIARWSFRGSDGTGFQSGVNIEYFVDGAVSAGVMPGRMVISTSPAGSATPVERLRIDSAGAFTVWDGGNVILGSTTGTKIGTATSQKLAFFNATPIIQPAAAAQAAAPAGGTGATAGAYDTAANRDAMIATVNAIRTALVNLGLMKGAA